MQSNYSLFTNLQTTQYSFSGFSVLQPLQITFAAKQFLESKHITGTGYLYCEYNPEGTSSLYTVVLLYLIIYWYGTVCFYHVFVTMVCKQFMYRYCDSFSIVNQQFLSHDVQ